ncbi:unnamed protein product [Phytomonas sp. Hart1]|nr:unnamed protein product [Phytomonas sp. Hart1]|eukprot:CCW68882.1 unnamed protein product [Phytomonas sp. isolate Hart1]
MQDKTISVKGQCKRPRYPPYSPIVKDYRPYTGRQLTQRPSITENFEQNIHRDCWNLYYRNNTFNGFKDRNYILREFVELREAIMASNSSDQAIINKNSKLHSCTGESRSVHNPKPFSWLEAGCGVGNAMLPIFKEFGHLAHWRLLLGFDISKVAINLLKDKKVSLPLPLQEKLHVCVLNPCEERLSGCLFPTPLGDAGTFSSIGSSSSLYNPTVEFVSMIFVLSSIPVPLHASVLKRIAECMVRPGGIFFFRDYARSDLAEKRFRSRKQGVSDTETERRNDVDGNLGGKNESSIFARTNGTLSYFFSKEELEKLFTSVGFSVIEIREVNREVENRKAALCMSRKFIQGRFRLEKVDI